MKRACCKDGDKTVSFVLLSLIFAVLAAAAAYCVHRFLLGDPDDYDDDEDYIDENGVCYTDEKNFID